MLMGVASLAEGQTAQLADMVRIAEAQRLAEQIQGKVWPNWEKAPFAVLFVAPDSEWLIGYPRTPSGFAEVGYSVLLRSKILSRPRQFDPKLLATFPAFGLPPVVVVGRADSTGKTSTEWVVTVLHEHFHQLQMSDTNYISAVDKLGLSGDDKTGMWMLNYPFPYQTPQIATAYAATSRRLAELLKGSTAEARQAFWRSYADFLASFTEKDRRYFSFQVWQEGISRYVELRVAELAATDYQPSVEFLALPGVEPFSEVAARMRAAIMKELLNPDLPKRKRVSFYAFGAGLGLLLDLDGQDWKQRYLSEKFFVERYAGVE